MKRYHLYIAGKVQGVWYRQSMCNEALKLGVKGWVKNLPDGRVEACVEGEEDAIKRLIDWCYIGPPHAIVKAVEVIEEDFKGEFLDFRIRY